MQSLLDGYRELERLLYKPEVRDFFREQEEPVRDKFVRLRREVTWQVGRLTLERLQAIADDLTELEPEFEEGADRLKESLNDLKDVTQVLTTISTVLGVMGRVLARL